MAEINWTREAQVWLRDIYNYIAIDNSDAAQRTVMGIFRKTQLLAEHPRLGHRYEAEKSREIRILSMATIVSPTSLSRTRASIYSEYFTVL